MVGLEVRGEAVEESKLTGAVLIVKDDTYTVRVKKTGRDVTIKLDATQKPKQIDMYFPDDSGIKKLAKGIYKLEGDKLIICRDQARDGAADRVFD